MKKRLPASLRSSSGAPRQQGFALLEVLVSILIFSFGVLGLVGLQARAISLLHGLESSLDYARGGEIAENLGRIYREARRLIGPTPGVDRQAALVQARDMLATVSSAWEAIGPMVNANAT